MPSKAEAGGGSGKAVLIGGLMAAAQICSGLTGGAQAAWEDGMASYNRGDYVPAIRLFRPLAEKGNAKAQNLIGVMYRKGKGSRAKCGRAPSWFSLAAKRRPQGESENGGVRKP